MTLRPDPVPRGIAIGFALLIVFILSYFTIKNPTAMNPYLVGCLGILASAIFALLGVKLPARKERDDDGPGQRHDRFDEWPYVAPKARPKDSPDVGLAEGANDPPKRILRPRDDAGSSDSSSRRAASRGFGPAGACG